MKQNFLQTTTKCASCHLPSQAFATNFPTNHGAFCADGTRNSLASKYWLSSIFYKRGRGAHLNALVPIQEENEFHNNILAIVDSLVLDPSYVEDAQEAYDSEMSPL